MSPSERSAATHFEDDPPLICRVTPEGEVICEGPIRFDAETPSRAQNAGLEAVLQKVFPESSWGPEKMELALRLLDVIGESKLPNDRVARRAVQSARALKDLLLPTPPSILLFNYSEQPANVMGAWFMNNAELARMQRVLHQFDKTVEP